MEDKALRRGELRQTNLEATARGGVQPGLGKLDTSLKRHTSLLTRFRSTLHTQSSLAGLLKDILGLSLEKYVEEAVGAVIEGLAKCKSGPEVACAVQIISALHQRFPELFTPPFTALLLQSLKPATSTASDKEVKEREDTARIVRQRGFLRVLGELEIVGIIRKDEGRGMTGEVSYGVLRDLLTADKESLGLVAPLGIAFAKHLGQLYLPPPPSTTATTVDSTEFPSLAENIFTKEERQDALVNQEMKDKFRKLLVAFLDALGRKEGRNHVELQRTDKRNHEAYIRSGEMFEDREKSYEKAVRAWERGWASVGQLSEILGLPIPVLPSLVSASAASIVTNGVSSFGTGEEIGGPGSLWADEEDKKFYEELRELRGEVPGSILGVIVEKTEEKEVAMEPEVEEVEAIETENVVEVEGEVTELEDPIAVSATADAAETALPAGPAAQLSALFSRLPDANSRSVIDTIAIEFAFLNSKAARKRLVKHLAAVPRNRQDILPYYARLVATLDPYMPDIGKELVALLEDEFRYLQRRKNAEMTETRAKNLRFLSELAKFRITPIHSILHIYKVLLDDFSGVNIDNLCTILEGCGRFLLRSPPTAEKMLGVLETLKRKKKSATHLDVRMVTSLENAYYMCDPPDRPAIAPKIRTPMQLYIRHLFYNALTRNSSDKVLKLVRKLNWDDPLTVRKLHSAFTKVWKIKYSNVHLFAVLLYDLGRYHPEFNTEVIDEVLENVRVGMEINSFKYNQQRIATIKYLGELYNYRVVESRVIFDTLWSFVTFGHREGRPHPDNTSTIDSPDDCFRIRLVCTLLDTCGSCFERGALKKKLDNFLIFFLMYVMSKGTLPMDVDFMLSDTFEQIRPKTVMPEDFTQAALAVDEMMVVVAKDGPVEDEPDELPAEGHGEQVDEGIRNDDEEDDEEDDTSSSSSTEKDDEEDVDDLSADDSSRRIDPNAITQEETDEFALELAKMQANTSSNVPLPSNSTNPSSLLASIGSLPLGSDSRKPNGNELRRKSKLDLAVPYFKRGAVRSLGFRAEEGESAEGEREKEGMVFTLLTKKGSKQQTIAMEIPLSSAIAMNRIETEASDRREQQEMKKLVLDYEMREEQNEKKALQVSMAKRGIKLQYKDQASTSAPPAPPPPPTGRPIYASIPTYPIDRKPAGK